MLPYDLLRTKKIVGTLIEATSLSSGKIPREKGSSCSLLVESNSSFNYNFPITFKIFTLFGSSYNKKYLFAKLVDIFKSLKGKANEKLS